jgi:hypothetical protein
MGKTFFALTILTIIMWLAAPLLEMLPLGHLPGDFTLSLGQVSLSFPLTSFVSCALLFYALYKIYLKFSD